jgi:hypothetical protein
MEHHLGNRRFTERHITRQKSTAPPPHRRAAEEGLTIEPGPAAGSLKRLLGRMACYWPNLGDQTRSGLRSQGGLGGPVPMPAVTRRMPERLAQPEAPPGVSVR